MSCEMGALLMGSTKGAGTIRLLFWPPDDEDAMGEGGW